MCVCVFICILRKYAFIVYHEVEVLMLRVIISFEAFESSRVFSFTESIHQHTTLFVDTASNEITLFFSFFLFFCAMKCRE